MGDFVEEEEDYVEVARDSAPSSRFKGIMHFKCLAYEDVPEYVGLRGSEFFKGDVDEHGYFTLKGYACEQPEHCQGELLSCCSYKWKLRDNGAAIHGILDTPVTAAADMFVLRRASESFATKF